jgi:hypothetical protein
VRQDKERQAGDGFDGSWVAHPDLVPVAGDRPNQLDRQRDDVQVRAEQLLDVKSTPGEVTEAGLRVNVEVGLRYIESWLMGVGAAAINNLMEDVATAEISRSQVWQWVHNAVRTSSGERVDAELVRRVLDEELAKLRQAVGEQTFEARRFKEARDIFEQVALADEFVEFLTLAAYHLDKLIDDGLLEPRYQRRSGRRGPGAGRPAKHDLRAASQIALSLPARDYATLAELLAGAVEADPSGAARAALQRAAGRLGAEVGAEAAGHTTPDGQPDQALAALRGALAARGYEPYDEPDGTIRPPTTEATEPVSHPPSDGPFLVSSLLMPRRGLAFLGGYKQVGDHGWLRRQRLCSVLGRSVVHGQPCRVL